MLFAIYWIFIDWQELFEERSSLKKKSKTSIHWRLFNIRILFSKQIKFLDFFNCMAQLISDYGRLNNLNLFSLYRFLTTSYAIQYITLFFFCFLFFFCYNRCYCNRIFLSSNKALLSWYFQYWYESQTDWKMKEIFFLRVVCNLVSGELNNETNG